MTTGAKTIAAVTEEFDLTETALRAWVKRSAQSDLNEHKPNPVNGSRSS